MNCQNKDWNGARIERNCSACKKRNTRICIIKTGIFTFILSIILFRNTFLRCGYIEKSYTNSMLKNLTVISEGIIQQLEKWEAVPGVLWLCLESWIHINRIQRQKLLCMLSQQFWPPSKCLWTWQNRITNHESKQREMFYLWQNTFGYVLPCPVSQGEEEWAKWKMWKYFIKLCIKKRKKSNRLWWERR